MAKDWSAERSPTVQAQRNNMLREASEAREYTIAMLRKEIDTVEAALNTLNDLHIGYDDSDIVTAVRSLGAYQALLKRKLAREVGGDGR